MSERTAQPTGERTGEPTGERADTPTLNVFGIHIPPEDAVALGLVVLEVTADAISRQRNAFSMRMLTFRRNLEWAVAHEGGFRMLLRNSRFYPKR